MGWFLAALLVCRALIPIGSGQQEGGVPPRRVMAITFDDLPGAGRGAKDLEGLRSITDRILHALAREQAPAVGFVVGSGLLVEGEVDARIAVLRRWAAAGMSLGNHTFSHLRLHDTPLQEYMDDVVRGDTITRMVMKEREQPVVYFRYPYSSTGSTREIKERFEEFLRARDYRIAPFTIEAADYAFDAVYVDALEKHDTSRAERTLREYLDHTDTMCDFFERRSRDVIGREVTQILLVHANEINAAALDQVLARLRARGYRFVTLDEALQDEAYSIADDYIGPRGISWIHRWTVSLGQEMDYRLEPDPPRFILDQYATIQGGR